ncbi:hypothetical protein HGG76_20730 [Ochrobactrum tritici]|uniref:Uncharacterized protein n=1 Tax=Brucella tritici TaxID=94626 RepID=A0A7X6FRM3_9HYPH|nr:hypothetical protein [Brucella tritici]
MLAKDNTYVGDTTIAGGMLQLGNGGQPEKSWAMSIPAGMQATKVRLSSTCRVIRIFGNDQRFW